MKWRNDTVVCAGAGRPHYNEGFRVPRAVVPALLPGCQFSSNDPHGQKVEGRHTGAAAKRKGVFQGVVDKPGGNEMRKARPGAQTSHGPTQSRGGKGARGGDAL